MMIDVAKDRKVGDVFSVPGDLRVFKVMEVGKTDAVGSGCRYLAYALATEIEGDRILRWRLDYENAKVLIRHFNLVVEYAKITHVPTDNIYLSQDVRKETGCFRNVGTRYIAESAIRNGSLSIIRTGSAGADNISWEYMTWAPDIACKRAIIKCVIDSLNMQMIDPEIVPAMIMAKDQPPDNVKIDEKLVDANQLKAIKSLLRKGKKKLSDVGGIGIKSYENMTSKQAEWVIGRLQK